MTGHVCWAVESPKEDDQEVTFPGGGRWGPERQTTPVPHSPAGGRVPSGMTTATTMSCTGSTRYGATHHSLTSESANRYSKNKHL